MKKERGQYDYPWYHVVWFALMCYMGWFLEKLERCKAKVRYRKNS